jgi:spore coat polysaccharide biosynthesis protein SpsF
VENKLKTVCIVQARLGSKRLPEKVLKIINNKPMIYWLILRLKKVRYFDKIVLAIPKFRNNKLLFFLKTIPGIVIYRGPEHNVLRRYYEAAKKFNADIITRITADDPLKDPDVISKSLSYFKKSKLDYYSNTIKQTFPIGIDVEHFTFKALKAANKLVKSNNDKEHVTSFFKRNDKIFNIKNFINNANLSRYSLTVDTQEDFNKIKKIFYKFKKKPFISYKKIINFLKNEKRN